MAVTINATTASGLQVTSDNSGVIQFQQNGTNTVTIPAGTGTAAVQGVSTNIVSATVQATTSGTTITFGSIPSWVKRITLMYSGITTNGSNVIQFQLGTSGGATTTGYTAASTQYNGAGSGATGALTTGFPIGQNTGSGTTYTGTMVFTLLTGNTWIATGVGLFNGTNGMTTSSGSIALGSTLTQVILTSVGSTSTFTAGSVNILYE